MLFCIGHRHAFNPSRGTGVFVNSRPAWSTQCVTRLPGLYREIMSGVGCILHIDSIHLIIAQCLFFPSLEVNLYMPTLSLVCIVCIETKSGVD